jgi:hypothetical protein
MVSCAKIPAIKSVEALMRGFQDGQTNMLAVISIEQRIPSDHPLRRIKRMADQELKKLSGVFNRMYSQVGRPSVAPREDFEVAVVDRAVLGEERATV